MVSRSTDGSAGDADYGAIGESYARYRRPDPRIAAQISAALGAARTVLNVGAGAGSYEPEDRLVTPVEPSASMRAQRPAGRATAVAATAEDLPFGDDSFDAAMTTFSVRQWSDLRAGLRELRRVTRGPVVILTGDPDQLRKFWLTEYVPEVIDTEAGRYPASPNSPTASAALSPRPRSTCRLTAPTGSTRRTTVAQKGSLTRRPVCPAPRGALSGPRCTTASPVT